MVVCDPGGYMATNSRAETGTLATGAMVAVGVGRGVAVAVAGALVGVGAAVGLGAAVGAIVVAAAVAAGAAVASSSPPQATISNTRAAAIMAQIILLCFNIVENIHYVPPDRLLATS